MSTCLTCNYQIMRCICIFSITRYFQSSFKRSCINLHPLWLCTGIQAALYPFCHLGQHQSFPLAVLTCMNFVPLSLFKSYLSYAYQCFFYICVCAQHVWQLPADWSYGWLWVLGIEPGSSARTSALDHQACIPPNLIIISNFTSLMNSEREPF